MIEIVIAVAVMTVDFAVAAVAVVIVKMVVGHHVLDPVHHVHDLDLTMTYTDYLFVDPLTMVVLDVHYFVFLFKINK